MGRHAAMNIEPEAGTMTCANCGAVVGRDEERCPSCSVPLQIVCPECGTQAPAVEDDCPACGASLAHATEAS
jgi:RNA polymerase subunit RPABC4/transcription elongation factor Spt4